MAAHDDNVGTVAATFTRPSIVTEPRPDGSVLVHSTEPLGAHSAHVGQELHRWADAAPDRVLITEPTPQGRRSVTYAQARGTAQALAQGLLDLGAAPDRPVLLLSGNSPEHLELTLACYLAGVPAVPASVAYSVSSTDHRQLRAMAALVRPGAVFVDDPTAFAAAIDAVVDATRATGTSVPTVITRAVPASRPGFPTVTFADLAGTTPGRAADEAYGAVTPDTVAKILFTSGSTGSPKGVLTTHRMLTSNQQMMRQVWPFLADEPPVLVDWLPWSHTFGGSHNVGLVLSNGGTLHIDAGRPAPALFDRTLTALAEITPTIYVNVPAGYTLLVPRLEADPGFARYFFSRLRLLFYAAAALPQVLWDRLERLVDQHADRPIPLTASWGTTETAPAATSAHWLGARCGCIGVPLPGVRLKLVPVDGKQEIRISGPSITPGYQDRPDATAAAFDDESFYRTGDAVVFVDADDPDQGLMFDGRIAEDFKLTTGTWVSVATVRGRLLSAARVLTDVVLAGHDREEVTALAWLNLDEARNICALPAGVDVPLDDPDLRRHLAAALAEAGADAGSAGRVTRLLLCEEPPDLDAGEITDKGYINQRAVLERRADLVERLYEAHPDAQTITPSPATRR